MDLAPYLDKMREQLAVAAETGGPEARALVERITAPLDSAIRLLLLEALSAAADEITRDLAPGSVQLRLRGLDPGFVVTPAPGEQPWAQPAPTAGGAAPESAGPPAAPDEAAGDRGATVRINLRLPEDLKGRIDDAASRERVSVNTWLVRAAASVLDAGGGAAGRVTTRRGATEGSRFTGWAR